MFSKHSRSSSSFVGVNCPLCSASHVPLKGQLTNGVYACTCESCGHFFKFRAFQDFKTSITFTVNGKEFTVTTAEYAPATVLNTFLRRSGVSKGTKGCCYEGGCGTCLATITAYEPLLKTTMRYTVNSCLYELYSCDGTDIITIEGLGDPTHGLHPIQERLANHDGAQCGFCSTSQVLNMYGLLKANPRPTQSLIEDHFDVTICRCTGYRSILDAMKTFAVDAPPHLKKELIDIEDLDGKLCKKTGQACTGTCHERDQLSGNCDNQISRPLYAVGATGVQWYTPTTLDMLLQLLKQHCEDNYRLVFGNTCFGVYPQYHPKMYKILIETRHIRDFYNISMGDQTLNLGANLTPQNLLDLFKEHRENPKLPYAGPFSEHMKHIAQQGVRNTACWAGNLVLKNKNFQPGFPSDLYLCFESVKALLYIYDGDNNKKVATIPEFLEMDLKGKVIGELVLPLYSSQDVFIRTYKVTLRLQNCRGYLNGALNFRLDTNKNFLVKERPTIIFGGIATNFNHAVQTEKYLTGKALGDPSVLREAFKVLSQELQPGPGFASPEYRKSLAFSFFYKYVLEVCKIKVSPEFMSGATGLMRTPIVGTQDYGTNPKIWPVTEPMPKRDAQYLTTGTARYLDDFPTPPDQLAGVPVMSTVAQGTIVTIDPTPALKMPGVVAFLQASDIPAGGVNNWRPMSLMKGKVQELLSSGPVNYAGQPIGIILAKTKGGGLKAAEAVKVTYKDVKPPIVTIEDAIKRKSFFPNPPPPKSVGDAKGAIASAPHRVSGSISCGDQFQFHLETQVVSCIKSDNGGMDVMATSQWLDGVQETVAQVLGIPESKVTVESKRIGGAFGGKITETFMVAGMTALAAKVLDVPVKMRLNLPTNMKMCGKRAAYRLDYTIGVDNDGKLLGLDVIVYADVGCEMITSDGTSIFNWIDNAYFCPNWLVTFVPLRTNKAVPASCRGPGSTPAIFFMESMMEHVARYLGKDEAVVRIKNLYKNGLTTPRGMILEYCTIRNVMGQHIAEVAYKDRRAQVYQFNKDNRWKKRGIAIMPNMFGIQWSGKQFNTEVIIHHGDASVSVGHGGIDVGQGINTKVIQVCAYEFGIPIEKIEVKKSSTTTNANSSVTGGSSTSELCCLGVIEACAILKKRMAPVKAKMDHPTWEQLVTKCFEEMVDLTASYSTHVKDPTKFHYNCYSAASVEAEIDVLTGQYQLLQMDMLYDCGDSMNPELDIGQAEGGFVMGLGYFLLEELVYDKKTGEITNASTWSYKPPMPKDLPMKFNFKFQRNRPNPIGVLGSKAVAEPALVMSAVALLAIKHAIESARADNGYTNYFALNAPATPEKIQMLCMNKVEDYTLRK